MCLSNVLSLSPSLSLSLCLRVANASACAGFVALCVCEAIIGQQGGACVRVCVYVCVASVTNYSNHH